MLYQEYLQKLGFSEPEAKIYLVLLRMGSLSAAEVATKTGIRRTNVYTYTAQLAKSGYISDFEKDGKTLFRAEHPNELRHLLSNKIREAENLKIEFMKILPKLEGLYQVASTQPVVRSFIGKKDYNALMDMLYIHINEQELLFLVPSLVDYAPPPPRYLNHLYTKNVFVHLFTNSHDHLEDFQKRDEKMNRATHYLDPSMMKVEQEMIIFGDSLAYGTFHKENMNVTVMHDSPIARMYKSALKWSIPSNS